MKSLISTVLAIAVLLTGLLAVPESTSAQTSGEGQPAPGAPPGPAPAASPAPDTAAQPAPTPAASEDAAPEDPVADEVVVREERDDDHRGRGDDGERSHPNFWFWFGRNVVFVLNRSDGDLRVRGRVRLIRVK